MGRDLDGAIPLQAQERRMIFLEYYQVTE